MAPQLWDRIYGTAQEQEQLVIPLGVTVRVRVEPALCSSRPSRSP